MLWTIVRGKCQLKQGLGLLYNNKEKSMFAGNNRRAGERRGPMEYIGIMESTEKQIQHGRFRRNSPSDFAIILPTTDAIRYGKLTSLFIIIGSDISYYVSYMAGDSAQLFPNVLSFQPTKQLLQKVFSEKCVICYENNGFGLRAIQQHFGIDRRLIGEAEKHDVLGKLRWLKLNEKGVSNSRQSMIVKEGLGNAELNALNAQKTAKLWNLRSRSKTNLNLLLAWGMMQALGTKYLAIMALWTCQYIFKRDVPNWKERLRDLKSQNASILLNFMESELKLDLQSEEVRAILAEI